MIFFVFDFKEIIYAIYERRSLYDTKRNFVRFCLFVVGGVLFVIEVNYLQEYRE